MSNLYYLYSSTRLKIAEKKTKQKLPPTPEPAIRLAICKTEEPIQRDTAIDGCIPFYFGGGNLKRLICALLLLAMLFSLSVPAFAADPNIDGGGGDMGQGTSQNSWTPAGMLQINLTDDLTIRDSLFSDWHIRPIK